MLNRSLIGTFVVMGFATPAHAQVTVEPPPDNTVTQAQAIAGAGPAGIAPGEVPPRQTPFQPPTTAKAEPPGQPANQDIYDRWIGMKSDLEKATGTTFELYLNPSDQVLFNGPSTVNRGVFWYNFHVGQKLWTDAQLLMNTRGGDGNGLDRYLGSTFNTNQHAGETSWGYISHLFLQQKLFDEKLTISIGKLDLLDFFDDNEVMGWNLIPYSAARNNGIPAPYHAIGGVVRWDVAPFLYVQAGAADAGGNPHQTGLNTAFDSDEPYFTMFEFGIKPKFFDRPGTYRFIGWYATGDIPTFEGGTQSGNGGFALSFDQQFTDHFSVGARYGYNNPAVQKINQYVSIGAALTEPIPGRKNDVLGMEAVEAFISGDYRAVNNAASQGTQFDLYYKVQITPWLSITPDLQVILNPDRSVGTSTEVIGGFWMELRF